MTRCSLDGPCAAWAVTNPGKREPKQHFHCIKTPCFSRGLLQDEIPFICASPAFAQRHVDSHEAHELKDEAKSEKLWAFLMKSSSSLHREVRTKNQTQFRVDINQRNKTESSVPQGTINWLSRLFIGKVGTTAEILVSTITQFGTNPGPQSIVTSPRPHIAHQPIPLPGHTILFHPRVNSSETWFGVCCSDIYEVVVSGDRGLGCLVQIFDTSHHGTWRGKPAIFYELQNLRQPQLLASMKYSGHVLLYDTCTSLFVSPQDTSAHESYLKAYPGGVQNHAEDMLARADELNTSDTQFGREDRAMLEALFKTDTLHFVDANGTPVNPTRCQPDSFGCRWKKKNHTGVFPYTYHHFEWAGVHL